MMVVSRTSMMAAVMSPSMMSQRYRATNAAASSPAVVCRACPAAATVLVVIRED
jgi:hypothetical protein